MTPTNITHDPDNLKLDDVKSHMQISFADDDALIQTYIDASLEYVQAQTGQSILTYQYGYDLPVIAEDKTLYLGTLPDEMNIIMEWQGQTLPAHILKYPQFSEYVSPVEGKTQVPNINSSGEVAPLFQVQLYDLTYDLIKRTGFQINSLEDFYNQKGMLLFQFVSHQVGNNSMVDLLRKQLVAFWYENREAGGYYTKKSIPFGAESIINNLRISPL